MENLWFERELESTIRQQAYQYSSSSYYQPPPNERQYDPSCSCFDCYNQQYHSTIESPDSCYQPSSSTLERSNGSWSLIDDNLGVFSKSTSRVLDQQDNDRVVYDELKILIQQTLEYTKKWDQKVNNTSIGESTTQKFQQEGIETTKEELYGVRSTNEQKVFDEMTERKCDRESSRFGGTMDESTSQQLQHDDEKEVQNQQELIETTKESQYEVQCSNEQKVFDEMTERQLNSTNKEVKYTLLKSEFVCASKVFDKMPEHNMAMGKRMLNEYARNEYARNEQYRDRLSLYRPWIDKEARSASKVFDRITDKGGSAHDEAACKISLGHIYSCKLRMKGSEGESATFFPKAAKLKSLTYSDSLYVDVFKRAIWKEHDSDTINQTTGQCLKKIQLNNAPQVLWQIDKVLLVGFAKNYSSHSEVFDDFMFVQDDPLKSDPYWEKFDLVGYPTLKLLASSFVGCLVPVSRVRHYPRFSGHINLDTWTLYKGQIGSRITTIIPASLSSKVQEYANVYMPNEMHIQLLRFRSKGAILINMSALQETSVTCVSEQLKIKSIIMRYWKYTGSSPMEIIVKTVVQRWKQQNVDTWDSFEHRDQTTTTGTSKTQSFVYSNGQGHVLQVRRPNRGFSTVFAERKRARDRLVFDEATPLTRELEDPTLIAMISILALAVCIQGLQQLQHYLQYPNVLAMNGYRGARARRVRACEDTQRNLQEKPTPPYTAEVETASKSYNSITARPIWAVSENYRFGPAFVESKKLMAHVGDRISVQVVVEGSMNNSNPYFSSSSSWRRDFTAGSILDMGVHFIARKLLPWEVSYHEAQIQNFQCLRTSIWRWGEYCDDPTFVDAAFNWSNPRHRS